MLKSEDKKSILKYRIEKSWLSLKEAKDVAALGYWNLAGNRIYYAVYYMASALLLDKGFITKTHAGVIHLLGAKFISAKQLTICLFISSGYGEYLFHVRSPASTCPIST